MMPVLTCSLNPQEEKLMHATASIAADAYQRPELIALTGGTPSAAKQEDRSHDGGADGLGCVKGMCVAFVMEATGALCLYLIWQIGHLIR
jgi:hypothetical protein